MLDRATTTPSISCVMPAYNEAGNLGRFVPQVLEALRALSPQVEVVIVNDGSRDQTAAAAIELTRQHPEVVLIDLSRNFGKEAALTAGMEAARGEVVILMDSDGQHPVSLMTQMLHRWREGMDVVYAVRKTRDDQTRLHANLAGLFYTLVNHNNRVKIPPNAGDFRLMDRAVVEAIKTLPERNRFMKGLYAWVGFKSVAIPYEPAERAVGTSNYSALKLIAFSIDGLTAFTTWPLRVASIAGMVMALLAFVYGTYVIVDFLIYGNKVSGWTTIIVLLSFFVGIQLIGLGILGEYIARIFEEVKSRPLYVVRRSLGQGLDVSAPGHTGD